LSIPAEKQAVNNDIHKVTHTSETYTKNNIVDSFGLQPNSRVLACGWLVSMLEICQQHKQQTTNNEYYQTRDRCRNSGFLRRFLLPYSTYGTCNIRPSGGRWLIRLLIFLLHFRGGEIVF